MSDINDISAWHKFLNIFSILYLVIDVIFILLGFMFAASLIDSETAAEIFGVNASQLSGVSISELSVVMGAGMVVSYAINLICLLFVRRGLKDYSKMTVGMVLFGIISVLAILNLISSIAGGASFGNALTVFCTALLNCCVFVGCYKVRAAA